MGLSAWEMERTTAHKACACPHVCVRGRGGHISHSPHVLKGQDEGQYHIYRKLPRLPFESCSNCGVQHSYILHRCNNHEFVVHVWALQ